MDSSDCRSRVKTIYGFFQYGCHEGNYAMPNRLPDRARKRSAGLKRRRAARRFPNTSNRHVAAAQAAVLVRVVAAAAVAAITSTT